MKKDCNVRKLLEDGRKTRSGAKVFRYVEISDPVVLQNLYRRERKMNESMKKRKNHSFFFSCPKKT